MGSLSVVQKVVNTSVHWTEMYFVFVSNTFLFYSSLLCRVILINHSFNIYFVPKQNLWKLIQHNYAWYFNDFALSIVTCDPACQHFRYPFITKIDDSNLLLQLSVKSAIAKFEKATNLVSMTGMFSKNESLDELPTDTLQYLLLPALLGTLTLKLCNQPRLELVNVAEIYFK